MVFCYYAHSADMDLWTRLWGRYHVPQNVFLVIIIIIIIERSPISASGTRREAMNDGDARPDMPRRQSYFHKFSNVMLEFRTCSYRIFISRWLAVSSLTNHRHWHRYSISIHSISMSMHVIRQWAYCKPTRYKYSITASLKFCSRLINARRNAQYLTSYHLIFYGRFSSLVFWSTCAISL